MERDVISRIAFAIQEHDLPRTKARRIAKTALAALQLGDRIGSDLVVWQVPTDGPKAAVEAAT